MTYKDYVKHLEKELNTVGSRETRNGNNNKVCAKWNEHDRYYSLFINGDPVGISMNPKECYAVLEVLCDLL